MPCWLMEGGISWKRRRMILDVMLNDVEQFANGLSQKKHEFKDSRPAL